MSRFTKKIDGKTIIKNAEHIIIRKDGMQTINPPREQIIADGWVECIEQVLPLTLEEVKQRKINDIILYDGSGAVNEFSMGGLPIWLDKATRAGLLLRFEAEAKAGRTSTTLWYNGLPFTLPLTYAQEILIALELYASACYDNTQSHIAEVQKMESKEAVEAYDYTGGYPAKLSFN